MPRLLAVAAIVALALLAPDASAQPVTAVVPPAFGAAEAPTGVTVLRSGARTYQVQFAASQLTAFPIGSVISGLTFRQDGAATSGSAAASFTNFRITLAQATNSVGNLSVDFADNMLNPMQVRGGPLTLAAGAFPGTPASREQFGTPITFGVPYTYQGGDLVALLSHTGGGTNIASDAVSSDGTRYDSLSADGFGALSASAAEPVAIFQFNLNPVPEPATVGLLAAAGLGAVRLVRRRPGRG